ncbi:MAG: lipopolysaccharide heptosyltransferase I [Rhodocyclaceae bacterium]|nr:lipopolysaccharide heptosyltransferase I [Rhodocyclaceae bacterium]
MRILLVKTSSLGDVIHNLPVVGDIRQHFPNVIIDWCVEESFSAIPRLHPGVNTVIPVALRRWKKNLFSMNTRREMAAFKRSISRLNYDIVLDTQGLLKSALLARQAQGVKCGYAADSAREPVAARFYDRVFSVAKSAHAVTRNRWLAAASLGYQPDQGIDFGLFSPSTAIAWLSATSFVVLLSATSRDDKLWPEAHWIALGQQLNHQGFTVILPSGSARERERATRLATAMPNAIAAPAMSIPELATLLAHAQAVVGVDTGLSHLAVALKTPTVAIYTATDPGLTGVLGSGYYKNLGGKGSVPDVQAVLAALQPLLG